MLLLTRRPLFHASCFPTMNFSLGSIEKTCKLSVTPFSETKKLAFRTLHEVLASMKRSSLGLSGTDTFPQQQRLKNRIPYFSRFLWIFGRYGEFKQDDGAHLIVDAKTYIDNRGSEKTLATWTYVKDVIFKVLPEFGIHAELVPSKKRWKTASAP